jgi:hypothetical protein
MTLTITIWNRVLVAVSSKLSACVIEGDKWEIDIATHFYQAPQIQYKDCFYLAEIAPGNDKEVAFCNAVGVGFLIHLFQEFFCVH